MFLYFIPGLPSPTTSIIRLSFQGDEPCVFFVFWFISVVSFSSRAAFVGCFTADFAAYCFYLSLFLRLIMFWLMFFLLIVFCGLLCHLSLLTVSWRTLPIVKVFSSTSLVTVVPAAINALSPTTSGATRLVFAPIKQSHPTVVLCFVLPS